MLYSNKMEKGQVPSAASIKTLSRYLNISADYLLADDDDINISH